MPCGIKISGTNLRFPSGIMAEYDNEPMAIGLNPTWLKDCGYDVWGGPDGVEFSDRDRVALADMMIDAWQRYRARYSGQTGGGDQHG